MCVIGYRGGAVSDEIDYNAWNQSVIAEFHATHGRMSGEREGWPVLLLHTVGAKSGQARINPLAYTVDGDHYIIIASKGGSPGHPDWYYNLVAHPDVTVEVGNEQFAAHATVAEEPERTRLYDKQAALMPNFAEYQQKTSRKI